MSPPLSQKALVDLEKAPVPLPGFSVRASGLAAASGFAGTLALLLSPLAEGFEPMPVPFVPLLDLRWIALPALFVVLHASVARSKWPRPALLLPGLALSVAAIAHLNSTAILGLLGMEGSLPGQRVDLVRTAASGASLLLALAAMLDRAGDRVVAIAKRAGATTPRLHALERMADKQASLTLGFATAAFIAFLLVARIGDAAIGGERAPLPEILGVVLAVGVAVLLFPGLAARRRASA